MPKQGHFAKSTRIKQLNNFRTKQKTSMAVIKKDKLTDFLVVRFALTAKKRVKPEYQETVQRFLIEICDNIQESKGDLAELMPQLLVSLNSRVPWQFYYEILAEWDLLQKFLQKELPAVPLKNRLRVKTVVSTLELQGLIARVLADKVTAITLINQPEVLPAKRKQMTMMMLATIYHEETIDWKKVRLLLGPFKFEVASDLDEGTQKWLRELRTR